MAPNVSFYLDEQPLAQPGRNLDVYAADVARIEVLSGPQGTLFGASSQAGVVRMITNKPKPGVTESNVEIETRFMPEGDTGTKLEFMTNVPLSDTTTWRFVGYRDRRGGYIDQVAGSVDPSMSARFRPSGTVRDNGLPVNSSRRRFPSWSRSFWSYVLQRTNALEEDNVNGTEYEGFRSTLASELGDNWNATLVYAEQTIESDGVFFADPNLGDLEIQRYSDDHISDEYENMSLTLEGSIGELEAVYAGAYTDRETNQIVDYTDYLFVGQYLPYYICDYYVTYTKFSPTGAPFGSCGTTDLFVDSTTHTSVESHEFRVNAPINDTMSMTAGVFMSDTELLELNLFTYPGSTANDITYAANYALTDTSVTGDRSDSNNASPGWYSAGPYSEPVIFFNDIKRTDEQKGVFGELNIALTDTSELLLVHVGMILLLIFKEVQTHLSTTVLVIQILSSLVQTYLLSMLLAMQMDILMLLNQMVVIGKVTYSWNPSEDIMYYVTWSEGFRPGLLNRPVGRSSPDGSYTVPASIDSDEITNVEFGWKTVLMDGQMRFNGSAF